MKVIKFLLSVGFKRRSKSSGFYDYTFNNINYCFQRNKKNGVMLKNLTDGGAVSIESVKSSFDEHHLLLLISMHDALDEVREYLESSIRIKAIDTILSDLENEPA